MSMPCPPIEKKWALCPYCGCKVCLFDNTANCSGVFEKCTRNQHCKAEFELVIIDGEQQFIK
jgi:hypothetical protein